MFSPFSEKDEPNLLDLIWVFEFHEAMAYPLRGEERGCEGEKGASTVDPLTITTVILSIRCSVFMLRRVSEEPRGHAAAIMTYVLLEVECKGIINASQKKTILQQIDLHLS
ncbi:hypothetical protein Dsin_003394 [Dipteronia sinensis]|uniref:Uncharacterized protein n=1 Tax=Dipteronia sinensis TaxID=43782 RepID=A0AAE0B8V6_9ROSI|nr:hypothetical protein Dsin_003394 [Dipteronia sinensis]